MFCWLRFAIGSLTSDSRGGALVTFALSLPLLICGFGVASDYAMMLKLKGDLQKAADAAAIAGAREISVAHKDREQIVSAAQAFATFALTGDSAAKEELQASDDIEIKATVAKDFSTVTVDIANEWTPFFANFIDSGITPVKVTATAKFMGNANICVLGLSPSLIGGVRLWNSAFLEAHNCGVFSNTNAPDGLAVMDSATLKSSLNCVVGGYQSFSAKAVEPTPVTDCPVIQDPLVARQNPKVGSCDFDNLVIKNKITTLLPGVYCGGLRISGTSKVTLSPGVYVIKGGPLIVTDSACLDGDSAGFFLTGMFSTVFFNMATSISLSAPKDGPLAGLLFFEDRSVSGIRVHRLASNNARMLLGTLYFSKSILNIDANAPVADQSAYTAIITQSLQLQSGPNLVLNSDYGATDVPVPDGIAGIGQVVLTQ